MMRKHRNDSVQQGRLEAQEALMINHVLYLELYNYQSTLQSKAVVRYMPREEQKQRKNSEYKRIIKDEKKTSDQIIPPGQKSPLSSTRVRISSPLTRCLQSR
jgi:hypothetical protein